MKPSVRRAEVACGRRGLIVDWSDGGRTEFASVWLRDNLPQDRDGHSGQRLTDVIDIPADPMIRAAALTGSGIRIDWDNETRSSVFSADWLYQQALEREPLEPGARHWLEGARLTRRDFASRALPAVQRDPGARLEWLTRLIQDGLAFLREVSGSEDGILEAMQSVGRIAETNYGLVFDVRAVPQPENLAYSDLGLGLHTDNPYREPVPGFQALHTLLAAPDGGDSLFADGFALAEHLRTVDPAAFALLAGTAVPFRYRSPQAELYAERPLISLDCAGAIRAVHYNARSIAPLRLAADRCRSFYRAYRCFAGLLREPRFQFRTRLESGELVVFDNQRILHGRTAFASARHARHLRGCYLTRDSVHSEAAVLRNAVRAREPSSREPSMQEPS